MCSQYHTLSGPLLEDWDIISPKDVISTDLLLVEKRSLAAAALPFTQSIISQVGLQGVELPTYIFIGWYLQDLIMQNAVACIPMNRFLYCSIILLLWKQGVSVLKMLVAFFKDLSGLGPGYLRDRLSLVKSTYLL